MQTIKFDVHSDDLELFRVAVAKSLAEAATMLTRAAEDLSAALLAGNDQKLIETRQADTEAAGRDLAETEMIVRQALATRAGESVNVEGSRQALHPITEIMVRELAADVDGSLQEANYDRAVKHASAMQGWVERAEYADDIVQHQLDRENAGSAA